MLLGTPAWAHYPATHARHAACNRRRGRVKSRFHGVRRPKRPRKIPGASCGGLRSGGFDSVDRRRRPCMPQRPPSPCGRAPHSLVRDSGRPMRRPPQRNPHFREPPAEPAVGEVTSDQVVAVTACGPRKSAPAGAGPARGSRNCEAEKSGGDGRRATAPGCLRPGVGTRLDQGLLSIAAAADRAGRIGEGTGFDGAESHVAQPRADLRGEPSRP
jgi:hypothetical protein